MATPALLKIDPVLLHNAIAAQGIAALGHALFALLNGWCPAHSLVITHYRAHQASTLFHNVAHDQILTTIDRYENGLFELDPFYNACINEKKSGVFCLRDLAPDYFHRSQYYLAFYQYIAPCEEVGIIMPELGLVLSLDCVSKKIAASALQSIRLAMPFISTLLKQQLPQSVTSAALTAQHFAHIASRYKLSEREQDVMRRVLQGHSSASIAAHLAIAETTVKVHRKHLYQKLNISTQAQLFRLYIDWQSAAQR